MQILILVLVLLSGAQLGFGAEPSPFQIRAISDVATATTSEYPTPKAEVPSKSVFVESIVLLDHTAIKRVSLEEGSAGFVHFVFTFNEAGQKQSDKIGRQYIGKRLGFLLAGRLVAAPKIHDWLDGTKLIVIAPLTMEEAEPILKKIQGSLAQ
jgi:preprotein translocase subunit SecD